MARRNSQLCYKALNAIAPATATTSVIRFSCPALTEVIKPKRLGIVTIFDHADSSPV